MSDDINLAVENVKKGVEFSLKNYRKFFPEMFKVTALAAGIVLAMVVLLALMFYLAFEMAGIEQIVGILLLLLAFAIIAVIVMAFITSAVNSVVYNIMDGWGKKTPIIANFRENFKPVFFYMLALFAINLIAFIPIIILTAAFVLGGVMAEQAEVAYVFGQLMVNMLSRLYQFVVGTILAFILQFAMFELIIARTGVINSIKKSYSIVKKTLAPTIVFDILAWLVELVISMAVLLALIIIGLLLVALGAGIYLALGSSATVLWILIALGILVLIFLGIVMTAVELTATLPMKYFYWKEVREIK